jgi:hypothetical protein
LSLFLPVIFGYFLLFRPSALLALRSLLEDGFLMSASPNNKRFFLWITIFPWFLPTWLFLWSLAALLVWRDDGSLMSASIYKKTCDISIILYSWYYGILAFFGPFRLFLTFKRWGRCWRLGLTCQPLCTKNLRYFDFFLHVILRDTCIFLILFI